MINIRLLGGAKKALGGDSSIQLEKQNASVADILRFLQDRSLQSSLLNPENLIVAINGVDSAALQGLQSVAKSGDTVTVVTVVHGGSTFTLLGGTHLAVVGVRNIGDNKAGDLLDRLRKKNERTCIQAARAEAVFGVEHALGVFLVALEARRRGIMMANKVETELLLRLAFTDQISDAIARAGLKEAHPACFIVFSEVLADVNLFIDYARASFEIDDSVLMPTRIKKLALAASLGLTGKISEHELLNHLLERAAIQVLG
ncbi:MAG TPA: KEOPS complex subunit Cgi121 [Nitrososphaera sp.]|nr:KEOPS complex subunit Cgi121 [Nitrososphaera sp.]